MRALLFQKVIADYSAIGGNCLISNPGRCTIYTSWCKFASKSARDKQFISSKPSTNSKVISEAMGKNYEEAVNTLNSLQSNAAVIAKIKKERDRYRLKNIPSMVECCTRVGLSVDDIDALSVIHVSGTKGKGSVCSLTESILRHNGLKTGFYSSPHLLEVRERIRLNGRPVQKEKFAEYFFQIYDALTVSQPSGEYDMPSYFRFLTLLAFHVFKMEKVDVAIIEVGLGGEFDCTNVVANPVVCGISSLGIDHVDVLGDTIAKIAWHKAGIMKYGCPAITVPQPEDGLDIIAERAKERQSPISLVPDFFAYDWSGPPPILGIRGPMQRLNASLALQLCSTFLSKYKVPLSERLTPATHKDDFRGEDIALARPFSVSSQSKKGLESCLWPGRNQIIRKPNVTYYLDGAHTSRSMSQCIEWFSEECTNERNKYSGKVLTFLVFNFTGSRQSEDLVKPLVQLNFDAVAFCPNFAYSNCDSVDAMNLMTTSSSQLERCQTNREVWKNYEAELNCRSPVLTEIFPSLAPAFGWCCRDKGDKFAIDYNALPALPPELENPDHIQVVVTGSLHLIGCALSILDPEMNNRDSP